MPDQTSTIISKVWGLCNPLRDDGLSYGDYLEQLTYLIFLKMSYEYSKPPHKRNVGIPEGCTWADMNTLKGAELEEKYKSILETLGEQGGILTKIFQGATNKINNAAILYRVVQMIDKENWVSMSSDVKGEIYEGLLQKNAEDIKSGAGQYFTPRPLIRAMVRCVSPEPMKTIADPCCGSGGFFLAAHSFIAENFTLDREQKEFLKNSTFYGNEIVSATYKTALMNLYLHNIGDIYGEVPITRGDALLTDPGYRVDYVLTNPPFGKKSSITFTNEEGEQEDEDLVYNRQDFSSTLCSISIPFSKQQARRLSLCLIMCCLRAAQAKPSANACSKQLTYIPFSDCRPVFSISPASRRTSSFLTSALQARIRRPKRFGFTTCAPICTLPSKRIP